MPETRYITETERGPVRWYAVGEPIVAKPQRYVMVENTPGYLPEEDEPFVSEDFDAVFAYMKERVESYCDFLCQSYEYADDYEPVVWWAENLRAAEVFDPRREHDLGRCFSVEEYEEA